MVDQVDRVGGCLAGCWQAGCVCGGGVGGGRGGENNNNNLPLPGWPGSNPTLHIHHPTTAPAPRCSNSAPQTLLLKPCSSNPAPQTL